MKRAGALLHCNLSGHRAVNLVGEPVFARNRLKLKHLLQIIGHFCGVVFQIGILLFDGFVVHYGARRVAKHIGKLQIDRVFVGLLVGESELHIARGLAHNIHWRALAVGNLLQVVYILVFQHQTHTLLTLVANNFLVRKSRVADRQFANVDNAACGFNQLRKAVQVATCTVVVDRDNRVVRLFAQGADCVVNAALHFGVRTLYGVQLNRVVVLARGNRRHCAAAHSNTVVVAAQNHHLVARLGVGLQAVLLFGVAHAASHHYHLVETEFLVLLEVLHCEQTSADKRLSELVAEVACTVRRLDKNLLRRLIEPLTRLGGLLPLMSAVKARIRSHINGRSGNRHTALAASHTVADFAARTSCGAIERFHSCGEVVSFGFQRVNRLVVSHFKEI